MVVKIFKIRKLGPTELTWEEKNSADYRYYPDDNSKLRNFIKQEQRRLKLIKKKEVKNG